MTGRRFIACCVVACARPPTPAPREGAMKVDVPVGAWQRDWISRHGGARDASVTVRYVQTPNVFGDVRIRGDRPALAGAASFADLSDDQLLALAKQNGFAGYTTSMARMRHGITRSTSSPPMKAPTSGGSSAPAMARC